MEEYKLQGTIAKLLAMLGMSTERIVGVVLTLKTEENCEKMLDWLADSKTDPSHSEVMEKAVEIAGYMRSTMIRL